MKEFRLRACRTVVYIGLSSGFLAVAKPQPAAAAVPFPADENWIKLTQNSQAIGDVSGDSPGPRDIVGNGDFPMAYVQSDATYLYFRLRINEKILQSATNLRPYGWGCVIDSNGDDSNYEYSSILDGVNNPDAVWLWQNPLQQMPNNPNDNPEIELARYLGPFKMGAPGYGYARQMPAGSVFPIGNADPDFFADWAVERSKLAPGVGPLTPLRFACGTAADGKQLSQDFSGATHLPSLFSDPPVICSDSGCIVQDCAGFGAACSIGIGGCAGTGITVCSANGPICNAVEKQPSAEVCDGIDNDCDEAIDEDNPGAGVDCTSAFPGVCSPGVTACAGGALVCNALVSPGSAGEVCDGLDNDCNGIPDDGKAGAGEPCQTDLLGVCAKGFTTCGGGQTNCIGPDPVAETCNSLDDDCDGATDEDFALGTSCSVGIGACAAKGQIVCDDATGAARCNAVAGAPVPETCGDMIDSDCDGQLDNNCPDTDGDGIEDHIEVIVGTDPKDADTDDDGVRDGSEPKWDQDSDGDDVINVLDPDSDDDGLFDGTELGLDCGGAGTNPAAGHCIADADEGETVTDPLDADTDDGSVPDGDEDTDKNGVVNGGERNPLEPTDDVPPKCEKDEQCPTGQICVDNECTEGCRGDGSTRCPDGQECTSSGPEAGVCQPIAWPEVPPPAVIVEGGCDCRTTTGESDRNRLAWALALSAMVVLRRKRR